MKNSEVFETIRDKVNQARKQLAKQARKQSISEDKMSLLTGQLGASKVTPSRLRGKPKSLEDHGQTVTINLPVLPDNLKETMPRVVYAHAKPTGGKCSILMRVDDLPWLVNYMYMYLHAKCGDSSSDEESSCGSSSSYGRPHYNTAVV